MSPAAEDKDDMERDLSSAIEASFNASPRTNSGTSRRAVDQLGQATAGLLKVEDELNALLAEITGHPEEKKPQAKDTAPEGMPMFDRVRADATTLAELAIRMHAKISYARERL